MKLRDLEKQCQERKRAAGRRLNADLDRCHVIQDGTAREQCKSRASAAYAAETERINRECMEGKQRVQSKARSKGGGSPPPGSASTLPLAIGPCSKDRPSHHSASWVARALLPATCVVIASLAP